MRRTVKVLEDGFGSLPSLGPLRSYLFEADVSSASTLPPYKIHSLVWSDLGGFRVPMSGTSDSRPHRALPRGGGGFAVKEAGVCGRRFYLCFTSTISRRSQPAVIAPGDGGVCCGFGLSPRSEPNKTVRSHSGDGGRPPPLPPAVAQPLPIVPPRPWKTWEINMFCYNYRLSRGLLDSLHARQYNPSTDMAGIQPSACSDLNNVLSTQSWTKLEKHV